MITVTGHGNSGIAIGNEAAAGNYSAIPTNEIIKSVSKAAAGHITKDDRQDQRKGNPNDKRNNQCP